MAIDKKITDLITATTDLTREVNVKKQILDSAVSQAVSSQVSAAQSESNVIALDDAYRAVFGTIGYQVPVPYATGIELTQATQTVEYDGETYAPIMSDLPFTTSGTFEVNKFRLIQGVSGADLAGPGGAALVGNAVMAVGSIADLLALPPGQRKADMRYLVASFHAGWEVADVYVGPVGGGPFLWDADSEEDDDGGTVLAVPGVTKGRFKRLWDGPKTPEMFGAKGDGSDDRDAIASLLASAGEIMIPAGKTYMVGSGHFYLQSNSHVFGKGTIKRLPGAGGHLLYITNATTNFLVEDITLDGNDRRVPYSTATVGSGNNIYINGANSDGIIRFTTLLNAARDGIYIRQDAGEVPSRIVVYKNKIIGSTRSSVSVVGGDDIEITHNQCIDFGLCGINFEAHAPATACRRGRVKHNLVVPAPLATSSSIAIQNPQRLSKENFYDFEVDDNIVYAVNGNTAIGSPGPGFGTYARRNTIYGAISAIGAYDIIEDNVMPTTGNHPLETTQAMIGTGTGGVVRRNTIMEAGSNGIYCSSGGATIEFNFVGPCGKFVTGSLKSEGIYSRGDGNIIRYNVTEDLQETPTTNRGIFVRDGINNVIEENEHRGTYLNVPYSITSSQDQSFRATGMRKHNYRNAPPTSGAWEVGDEIKNSAPAPGGYMGWVCVTAGDFVSETPVFKGYGAITE